MGVSLKMNIFLELAGFLRLSKILHCMAQGNVHYHDFVVSIQRTDYFTITFISLSFFFFFDKEKKNS
jgi:inner membrane protein involved in colicin E2 resistance